MFNKIITVSLIVVLGMFSSTVVFANEAKQPISIFLAGDSTVQNYKSDAFPQAGWGQFIGNYFSKELTIKNRAIGGRSSKSFINEGRLTSLLKEIQPGDYMLIQFGHNDATKDKPERYADADTTYKECLRQYVQGARAHGAIPILITPVAQRTFDENGHILPSHGKYPAAMKQVGQEENVLVIDLTTVSQNYFGSVGPEGTKELFMNMEPGEYANYPEGKRDNTHFKEAGSKVVAKLIIGELQKTASPLKSYLVDSALISD